MSEITEIEIKSMTKEQNYMRGYEDGKSDVLDKLKAEIGHEYRVESEHPYGQGLRRALEIINRYKAEGSGK